jgi:hypothetical protein
MRTGAAAPVPMAKITRPKCRGTAQRTSLRITPLRTGVASSDALDKPTQLFSATRSNQHDGISLPVSAFATRIQTIPFHSMRTDPVIA